MSELGDATFAYNTTIRDAVRSVHHWELRSTDDRVFAARTVLLALGLYWRPRPLVHADNWRARKVIHSANYDPERVCPGSEALVIGSGNSAADVALSLVRRGAHVTLAWRSTPWILRRFSGSVPADQTDYSTSGVPQDDRGLAVQQWLAKDAEPETQRLLDLTGERPRGLPFQTSTLIGDELLDLAERSDALRLDRPESRNRAYDLAVQAIGYTADSTGNLAGLTDNLDATGSFSFAPGVFAAGARISEGADIPLQAVVAETTAALIELTIRQPSLADTLKAQCLDHASDLLWGFRPPAPQDRNGATFVFSEALSRASESIRERAEDQLARRPSENCPARSAGLHDTDSALHLAKYIPPVGPPEADDHDLLLMYEDVDRLKALAEMLVAPYRSMGITRVLGQEARGFLIGGICAVELGVGFVAARKDGSYMPGELVSAVSDPDWESKRVRFHMSKRSLSARDRVLVVDDWYTTGNQCRAIRRLVEDLGATFVGASVVVEEGYSDLSDLGLFTALLRWNRDDRAFHPSPYRVQPQAEVSDI
jgi:adenine phosphoribosyltransferase